MNSDQHRWWSRAFSGDEYYYGFDAGPVARRAVRYHQPSLRPGAMPTALDAGCGEGQDLAFLVEAGYDATGLDFTNEGIAKARRLIQTRELDAQTFVSDLRVWQAPQTYDLVLAVNCLQFLGEDAPPALGKLISAVTPRGVLGLSVFASEDSAPRVQGDVFFWTLDELMQTLNPPRQPRRWQMLETANLWQWNERSNTAQAFATLIARRL